MLFHAWYHPVTMLLLTTLTTACAMPKQDDGISINGGNTGTFDAQKPVVIQRLANGLLIY